MLRALAQESHIVLENIRAPGSSMEKDASSFDPGHYR